MQSAWLDAKATAEPAHIFQLRLTKLELSQLSSHDHFYIFHRWLLTSQIANPRGQFGLAETLLLVIIQFILQPTHYSLFSSHTSMLQSHLTQMKSQTT
jgi:hypothetical protein